MRVATWPEVIRKILNIFINIFMQVCLAAVSKVQKFINRGRQPDSCKYPFHRDIQLPTLGTPDGAIYDYIVRDSSKCLPLNFPSRVAVKALAQFLRQLVFIQVRLLTAQFLMVQLTRVS